MQDELIQRWVRSRYKSATSFLSCLQQWGVSRFHGFFVPAPCFQSLGIPVVMDLGETVIASEVVCKPLLSFRITGIQFAGMLTHPLGLQEEHLSKTFMLSTIITHLSMDVKGWLKVFYSFV